MKRVGVCLVLALCVGCSTSGNLLSAEEAQREFEAARSEIPLPGGYEFAEFQIPDADASYERGFGDVQAETYAQCAWFDHWLDSVESDDVQGMQESLGVLMTFRSGFKYTNADSSYKRGFDQVLEAMTNSSPDLVTRELDINCPELTDCRGARKSLVRLLIACPLGQAIREDPGRFSICGFSSEITVVLGAID